jgi:outer membrane lipoprotein-sorting protein
VTEKRKFFVFGLALACTLLGACRPVPVRSLSDAALPKPQLALEQLRARVSQLQGIQSLGRVTYFGEKGRLRLKTVLLAQRPTKFRIETLSPLEQPLQVMVSDGERLSLLADGQFYEGKSSAANVARILPLPLSPTDLVDALLSGVPMDPRYKARDIAWVENSTELQRLTIGAEALGEVSLDFRPSDLTVHRLQLPASASRPELVIRFERFEELSSPKGFLLARRIKLKLSNYENELSLKLNEVTSNVGIKPNLFVLSPPEGVTPIDLDFGQ